MLFIRDSLDIWFIYWFQCYTSRNEFPKNGGKSNTTRTRHRLFIDLIINWLNFVKNVQELENLVYSTLYTKINIFTTCSTSFLLLRDISLPSSVLTGKMISAPVTWQNTCRFSGSNHIFNGGSSFQEEHSTVLNLFL